MFYSIIRKASENEMKTEVGDFRLCSFFFFSSRRRHTRLQGDWSSDVCSSDLRVVGVLELLPPAGQAFIDLADVGAQAHEVEARAKARLGHQAERRGARALVKEIGRASCRERV